VRQASDVVLTEFEKPADQSENVKVKRASFGQQYYDKYYKKQPSKQASQNVKYYRVQCGAFKNKNSAFKLQEDLKNFGFNSIIKNVDGLHKVQLGAYSNKQNAEKMLQNVKSKGFSAVIVFC
jgi:cell division protein FtsN